VDLTFALLPQVPKPRQPSKGGFRHRPLHVKKEHGLCGRRPLLGESQPRWIPTYSVPLPYDTFADEIYARVVITFAGLPWLRYLRQQCNGIHFWPFDGWDAPQGRSVVAEVYPSLWMRRFPVDGRNRDQQAAYSIAAWFRRADLNGSLPRFLNPSLEPNERTVARVEGWILGVV
jgi:hypothetical protein